MHQDPLAVGVIVFARAVPYLLFGLLGGAYGGATHLATAAACIGWLFVLMSVLLVAVSIGRVIHLSVIGPVPVA